MATRKGVVKDPHGEQAEPTWGYIQRFDGPKWPCSTIWRWLFRRRKMIPFLNVEGFKRGQLVTFEIEKITVVDPTFKRGGSIGIATDVKLKRHK